MLFGGRGWLAAFGAILAVPEVLGEAEGLRVCIWSDIESARGPILGLEDDEVFLEDPISARNETGEGGLLENSDDPLLRMIDGVVTNPRAIHADKRKGRRGTGEGVPFHKDVLRFVFSSGRHLLEGRAEEGDAGAAADVDGSFTRVLK